MHGLQYYLNLIPSQHRDKPKFVATVTIRIKFYVEMQRFLQSMTREFDIDWSVGVQLDQNGEWIGRTRYVSVPLDGVYFSWGISGIGWNEGVWKGQHDPETGVEVLSDDVYRQLLKAKIAANHWDGTIPGAYEVFEMAFEGTGSTILIEDHQDMSMTICIAGSPLDAVMREILRQGYLPLKPQGVRIKDYITTFRGDPFFAWDCDSEFLKGWGEGHWPYSLFDYEHYPEEYSDDPYLTEGENGDLYVRDSIDPDAEDIIFKHDENGNVTIRQDLPALANTKHKYIQEDGDIVILD